MPALTWRPGRADQRAVRAERQRQDQFAGGGVAAGSRAWPAGCAQRRSAAARRCRRLGGGRAVRHLEGEADIGTGTLPDGPPDRRVFRLDGATPRSQARDRRARCSGMADAADGPAVPGGARAAAASSTGWSGRWSPATPARSRRTMPPWHSATGCWRRAARSVVARRTGGRDGAPCRGRHRGARLSWWRG